MALQKPAAVRVASFDREKHTYTLLDDTFRLAVQAEVRVAGRAGGDGAGSYFRRGRLTSIPGNKEVRSDGQAHRYAGQCLQTSSRLRQPQV
ncbi:hypothetical protein SAMN05216275_118128 [Streptosporangium canum]|uniref:Uncharacterized protein n=1 Tax=Streptosporangium canum TaxID=324952 RepID=A0A1I3X7Z5_9ACTN|nr:hypothetical protein [Streptosporangium canum]SFK15775.1 hypothetical protein SAMN05216275_118128 [Streptosporangium canum]